MKNNNSMESKLASSFDFRYNEITNKLYYKEKSITAYKEVKEFELNSILRALKACGENKLRKRELVEILNSNFTPVFNPFAKYFESLKPWAEGDADYIQELADTITVSEAEKPNWDAWFKKWMVAVVAGAINDKVVNHQALIFISTQGLGKTTWMKKLVPQRLESYYYGGTIQLGNKDTEIQLAENLLINMDELENMTKRNISALKEIVTKPTVKLRRPYAASAENMPRRASFMGSLNNREFLDDPTGNRRFLCFEVLKIDYQSMINMDDVYAQALSLFKSGFVYWFEGEDIKAINLHNTFYKQVSLEEEILESLFEPCPVGQEEEIRLETENLLELIYEQSGIAKRLSPRNLGIALKKLNWPKIKTNGGRRYWLLNPKK